MTKLSVPPPCTWYLQVLHLVEQHGLAISKFELESERVVKARYAWTHEDFAGLVSAMPKLSFLSVSDLQSFAIPLEPLQSLQGLTALVLRINVKEPSIGYDLRILSHLKDLRKLHFDVTMCTGTLHVTGSLAELDRLSALDFGVMGYEASATGVMDVVRSIANLHELSLTGELSHKIDLAGITGLRSLVLTSPLATGELSIPLEEQLLPLLHMPFLSSLTLDQFPYATDAMVCVSWKKIWQGLMSLPELRDIRVSNADLSQLEDEDWHFGTQVKNLSLAACQLDCLPKALVNLTTLLSLALHNNVLEKLPAGSYLQQLTSLNISCNSMGLPGEVPAALVLCSSLKSLTWFFMDLVYDDMVFWERSIVKCLLPHGCEVHELYEHIDHAYDASSQDSDD